MKVICKELQILSSLENEEYIGVAISAEEVQTHIDDLKAHLGDEYSVYDKNRQSRDGPDYHVTVVRPPEWIDIQQTRDISALLSTSVTIQLIGLGKAILDEKTAYFVVAESNEIDSVRTQLGLGEHDLHVTLGFDPEDAHGVPKDARTLINR